MSIGALKRQTKNFLFNIVNFNFARWHAYEHENWDLLDAILGEYVSGSGLKGIWKNSTLYSVNDRVIDAEEGGIYLCLISHTSAATPTTFAANRLANPTYWRAITYDPVNAGAWTTATVYAKDSFVTDNGRYGIVLDDYTSGASYNADVAANHIDTLIDLANDPIYVAYDTRLDAIEANNWVTTARIGDDQVTNAELANMAASTLKGRVTGSTGDPEDVTVAQLRDTFLPDGAIVDRAYAEYTANADITAIIPTDDTIPQIGEGTQILSVAITPKKTTNRLRIRVVLNGTGNVVTTLTAALFLNGGANAIRAVGVAVPTGNLLIQWVLEHELVPGATTPQTFTVRVGVGTASTMRMNGVPTTRVYGGVAACTIIVEEIKAS